MTAVKDDEHKNEALREKGFRLLPRSLMGDRADTAFHVPPMTRALGDTLPAARVLRVFPVRGKPLPEGAMSEKKVQTIGGRPCRETSH